MRHLTPIQLHRCNRSMHMLAAKHWKASTYHYDITKNFHNKLMKENNEEKVTIWSPMSSLIQKIVKHPQSLLMEPCQSIHYCIRVESFKHAHFFPASRPTCSFSMYFLLTLYFPFLTIQAPPSLFITRRHYCMLSTTHDVLNTCKLCKILPVNAVHVAQS